MKDKIRKIAWTKHIEELRPNKGNKWLIDFLNTSDFKKHENELMNTSIQETAKKIFKQFESLLPDKEMISMDYPDYQGLKMKWIRDKKGKINK